jgi:hypothetical protein
MMSATPVFDPYGDQRQTEKKPRNWFVTCLVGCFIFVAVIIVIIGIGIFWISQNWRRLSEPGSKMVLQMVNESDLPQQEKDEIEVQVNRVADAIRDGDMSLEQMGEIFEKLTQSPVMITIIVSTAHAKYINQSGLTEDEKAQAKTTVHRFVRGAMDGTIDEPSVEATLQHIGERQPNGGWQLKDRVTDEELRAFLTAARMEADEANVPDEPEAFDPSDEVKQIIDEVMNEPAELNEPAEIEMNEPVETNEPPEVNEPPGRNEPVEENESVGR